jgi:hypothetical protein
MRRTLSSLLMLPTIPSRSPCKPARSRMRAQLLAAGVHAADECKAGGGERSCKPAEFKGEWYGEVSLWWEWWVRWLMGSLRFGRRAQPSSRVDLAVAGSG